MKVLSVRKGGFDVNEFADRVLILNPDGVSWRPASVDDFSSPANFLFHGYNCGSEFPDDKALDAARSIDSIWRQLDLPYEPACCLWPGLGERKIEATRFHLAIRNARRSAALYSNFLSGLRPNYMLTGHSLGCGLIGFLLDHVARPADLAIWMGAAVPQYATAFVDPKKESNDKIGRIMGGHLYDFADGLAKNTKQLINVIGNDPVLRGPFELSVRENACGAHGAWPGPERIPNVLDLDFRDQIHEHGHYRHFLPMWHQLKRHLNWTVNA